MGTPSLIARKGARQSSVTPSRSRSEYRRMYSSMTSATLAGTGKTLALVGHAVNAEGSAERRRLPSVPARSSRARPPHVASPVPRASVASPPARTQHSCLDVGEGLLERAELGEQLVEGLWRRWTPFVSPRRAAPSACRSRSRRLPAPASVPDRGAVGGGPRVRDRSLGRVLLRLDDRRSGIWNNLSEGGGGIAARRSEGPRRPPACAARPFRLAA